MSGTDVAADVPGKYDIVVDGYGYVTARAVDPNLPFRVQQQSFSYSPTFVERQNVSNAYGDNAQDFFLTIRQRDWSLGEQQKYYRVGNDGHYWVGSNVDVSTPGQVTLEPTTPSVSFGTSVITGTKDIAITSVLAASSTILYRLDVTGAVTSLGAHGLGAAPKKFAAASDGATTYISTSAAGTVGVRQWDSSAFATFSATAADSLAFVNNTLYGWNSTSSNLFRYDSVGAVTDLFDWKNARGGTGGGSTGQYAPVMCSYGGKILLCFPFAQEASELWIYDGTGTSRLEVFPPNFVATDIEVLYGIVYVAGNFYKAASSTTWNVKPCVLFFDGSQIGLLWQANAYSTYTVTGPTTEPGPALGVAAGRLVFTDDTMATMMAYDPARGGVSTIGAYVAGGSSAVVITSNSMVANIRSQTTGYYFPHATTYNTSGYVASSLIDFDSSLSKVFRGVTVEFDAATDGNGGSVDVGYQVNGLAGNYTSLATGVTSGTEVTLPAGTTGHSVSIKITLNKGTSTAGPTLKSMSVRGAPVTPPYRLNSFILDLGGAYANPVRRRDDSEHTLTGEEMRVNLAAAITSQTPLTVIDITGTYTAFLEPAQCEFDTNRPSQYYARIQTREV